MGKRAGGKSKENSGRISNGKLISNKMVKIQKKKKRKANRVSGCRPKFIQYLIEETKNRAAERITAAETTETLNSTAVRKSADCYSNQIAQNHFLRTTGRDKATQSISSQYSRKKNFKKRNMSSPKTNQNFNCNSVAEEGEIISEDEQPISSALEEPAAKNDDSDCICIESTIEQIIIDDDTPNLSLSHINQPESINRPLSTSTPLTQNNKSETRIRSKRIANQKIMPLFFEDTTPSAWFDTCLADGNVSTYNKLNPITDSKKRTLLPSSDTGNSDIIVLDDTSDDTILKSKQPNQSSMDDSVIFIGFLKGSNTTVKHSENPTPAVKTPSNYNNEKMAVQELFTASEKKQLNAYNNNTYNPTVGIANNNKKRMIIIDGSNVAFTHALSKQFSVKGLKICIDYFELMGHEVKAVVPLFRSQKFKSSDPDELKRLHLEGKIVFTPCKNLPTMSSTSYDDRFVLQLASELDAAVISNDNYRDLINETTAFKKIIENRVVGYTWCNDVFIIPKDPYGRWGPSLSSILNRV